MLKNKTKSDSLPSLQQAIIIYLAKNEPQTINQISKTIDKDYSNTHTAFKSLVKKKLIKETGSKNYRKQEFECYWLTDEGIITALNEGADAKILLQTTKKFYPNAEAAHIFLEIVPYFDFEIIKMAQTYIQNKENLTFAEVAQVILSGAASGMEVEQAKGIVTILKRYPNHYNALKMIIEVMIKQLNSLIED
jgi:hypothetical protein